MDVKDFSCVPSFTE